MAVGLMLEDGVGLVRRVLVVEGDLVGDRIR